MKERNKPTKSFIARSIEEIVKELECDEVMNTQCFTIKITKPYNEANATEADILGVLERYFPPMWGIAVFNRTISPDCPYYPCTNKEQIKQAELENIRGAQESIDRQVKDIYKESEIIFKKYGL